MMETFFCLHCDHERSVEKSVRVGNTYVCLSCQKSKKAPTTGAKRSKLKKRQKNPYTESRITYVLKNT